STLPTRASRVFEPRLVIRMAAPGSPSSRYSKKVSTAASACYSANGLPGEISRSGREHAVIRKSATTPTGKYAVNDRFFAMPLYLFISRSSPQTTAFAGAVDLQHPFDRWRALDKDRVVILVIQHAPCGSFLPAIGSGSP